MPIKITFDDSSGGREEMSDFTWLKEKVFNAGDDFWKGATGQPALSFSDERVRASMFLTGRDEYGFMIDHRYSGELTLSLRYGEHTNETIETYIGGEPDLYFKEYFVPREIAWQAIEYFLEAGERNPNLTWEIAEIVEAG